MQYTGLTEESIKAVGLGERRFGDLDGIFMVSPEFMMGIVKTSSAVAPALLSIELSLDLWESPQVTGLPMWCEICPHTSKLKRPLCDWALVFIWMRTSSKAFRPVVLSLNRTVLNGSFALTIRSSTTLSQ